MYHAIHWCAKANNKYMKLCHPNKESSYLVYWHVNNLYGWTMSQKLPVDGFEWSKDVFRFDKDNNKAYILEIEVDYPKNYRNNTMIFHSYLKASVLKKAIDHGLMLDKVHKVIMFS